MNIEKERELFEAWVIENLADGRSMSWEGWCWKAWQAAKAQAVQEISASIAVHQIIIDEIKTEIDEGYDLRQDSYLLDVLVERGIEIGKIQAVQEGFILVPKEPSADLVNHGHQVFLGHFNEGGQTGGRSLYFAYKAMIEAQEQNQ